MNIKHGHIALLIFAALVTAVVMSAYGYMHGAVALSAKHAIDARDLVIAGRSDKSRQQDIVELYQSTAESRARIGGLFIPADQPVTFIESVESLGVQAGSSVALSAISADSLDGAAAGTIGDAHVHLDAHGSWASVMRTLMLAEVLPYKTQIDQIHLDESTSGDGMKAVHDWRLSFDVHTDVVVASST